MIGVVDLEGWRFVKIEPEPISFNFIVQAFTFTNRFQLSKITLAILIPPKLFVPYSNY